MKKLLILLLLALPLAAQTVHTFPALDTDNTFTGPDLFNLLQMKNHTVSELSSLSPKRNGLTQLITDGSTATDCTVGSGSFYVLCYYKTGDSTWHPYFSGAGSQVSLEYLYPLDYTNAPSPTTSTDLIRTLFPQGVSTVFRGPMEGASTGPFIYQSKLCTGSDATASCQFDSPSKAGHAIAVLWTPRANTTTHSGLPSDASSNTYVDLSCGVGAGACISYALNIAASTSGTPLNTISVANNGGYWQLTILEIGGVPASPIEASALNLTTGCSGSTVTFPSVTTSATDLIVVLMGSSESSGPGPSTFTAQPGYTLAESLNIAGGGLYPYTNSVAFSGLVAAGTIAPTLDMTNCQAQKSATIAFTDGGTDEAALPRFGKVVASDFSNWGLTLAPTFDHDGNSLGQIHIVADTCTLGTDCAITLSSSAAYSGSSTYKCVATDNTAEGATKVAYSSGTAFTITGTGTDIISYICIGN